MTQMQTLNDGLETLSNEHVAGLLTALADRIEGLCKQVGHVDETVNGIEQKVADVQAFIDEHKPALARGLSLINPGGAIRKALKPHGRA